MWLRNLDNHNAETKHLLDNYVQHLAGITGVLGPDVQRLVQEEHKLEPEPATELVLPIQTAQDNIILHHTDKAVPAALGLAALVGSLFKL